MSLDLSLQKHCEHCNKTDSALEWNYTYNVAPMWYAIYPHHKNMLPIEGLSGKNAMVFILGAIDAMEADMPRFEAMNPSNGWGSAKSFLQKLKELAKACDDYPDYTWSAGR